MSDEMQRLPGMVNLSDLIIYHPEVKSFDDLMVLVARTAKEGARFLNYDVKPDYGDTPKKWQTDLERVFMLGERYLRDRA